MIWEQGRPRDKLSITQTATQPLPCSVSGWIEVKRLSYHLSNRESFLVFSFLNKFIYFWLPWVFVAACGLSFSCGERGLLFVAVRGLLIAVASLVAEHRL